MLVSVVIPAYNAEQWVAETIDSVLQQTYRNLEIILVDDGSEDRTRVMAEEALKNAAVPNCIVSQPNSGAAGARNAGLKAARGEWIQFLDADDVLEHSKIELQINTLKLDQTADVIYSNWQKLFWQNAWVPIDPRSPILQTDPIPGILSDRNFLQLGCMLFKGSVVKEVSGFDREHEPIEDVGLCIKVALRGGRFVRAPSAGPVSSYRDLPGSFSKLNQRKFIESCVKNAKLVERYIELHPKTRSPERVAAVVGVYFSATRFFAGYDWTRFEELVADIENLTPNFVPQAPRHLHLLSQLAGYKRAERIAVAYRRGKRLGGGLFNNSDQRIG